MDEAPHDVTPPRRVTRRTAAKLCVLGGLCAAGVAPLAFLLREAKRSSLIEVFKGRAPAEPGRFSTEALHWVTLGHNVQCHLCPNECILEPGDVGACRVRAHIDGTLYSLVYGNPCSANVDPIEKKPLYHFYPESLAFSIATAGCNLRCLNCQNWEISQSFPQDLRTADASPGRIVEAAATARCWSIAYTYSEPTVFYEYMLECARQAHAQGIKNVWVTNGYMQEQPLRELAPYLDGANVDLKSFDETTYTTLNSGHLQPVLDTLVRLKELDVWFEITTLIVPTYVDDLEMLRRMCDWILEHLGPDYPLHLSRFHPQHKLEHLPATPVSVMEEAREVARGAGLHHVYLGNVPPRNPARLSEYDYQDTRCPGCEKLLVRRLGYLVKQRFIEHGTCMHCGRKVAGRWYHVD
jgi:pyruvate formate lyase activating enzyme